MPLDLAVAKANLAAEIAETRATLARLEASAQLIEHASPDIALILDTLSRYSRKPRTDASAIAVVDIPEGATDLDVIRLIVHAAPGPIRAADVAEHEHAKARHISVDTAAQALVRLVDQKKVKRMSRGLYWRAAGKKGNGVIDQITNNGNGNNGLAALNPKAKSVALIPIVAKAMEAMGKPHTLAELTAAVEAEHFPFTGEDHAGAVKRAVTALGRKVRLSGHSRSARYEWRG